MRACPFDCRLWSLKILLVTAPAATEIQAFQPRTVLRNRPLNGLYTAVREPCSFGQSTHRHPAFKTGTMPEMIRRSPSGLTGTSAFRRSMRKASLTQRDAIFRSKSRRPRQGFFNRPPAPTSRRSAARRGRRSDDTARSHRPPSGRRGPAGRARSSRWAGDRTRRDHRPSPCRAPGARR